jgi:hypothetical protein
VGEAISTLQVFLRESTVYAIEPRITVKVEYGRRARSADVTIPWHLLRFLDKHTERRFTADGDVIYRLARGATSTRDEFGGSYGRIPGSA